MQIIEQIIEKSAKYESNEEQSIKEMIEDNSGNEETNEESNLKEEAIS